MSQVQSGGRMLAGVYFSYHLHISQLLNNIRMQNVASYNDDDALLDMLTFLAIQGYLCFKMHFLQCYLHDIFIALWQQSMKSSADIKLNFYSVKIPLIHLIVCSW